MRKSLQLLVAVCASFAGLVFAGPALGAYTPRLILSTESHATNGNGEVEILISQRREHNATAKVSILAPAGWAANIAQAPGTRLGSVDALVAPPAGPPVTLDGIVVVANPAEYAAAAAACGTVPTPEAVWLLSLKPSTGAE
ncbi:MAG: hypothetical protein M3M94_06490, partial [Actinomycetota bacterium]|nr:hypothetical protein [Actinomycetota bacterium]